MRNSGAASRSRRPGRVPGPVLWAVVPTVAELWRRGQEGWPSRFVLVQLPNAPLLVGLGGVVVARTTGGGAVHDGARVVATAGLGVWAIMELTQGVNWFRRGLGAGFLVYLIVSRLF
jgi:hypothetical protein